MSFSWDSFFSFRKTRLLIKVDDEYIIQIIEMAIDSFKIFSYYGSNPVALKDMHNYIHMYFFRVHRCRRPVAAADVNFYIKIEKHLFFLRKFLLHKQNVVIFANSGGSEKKIIHGLYSKFLTLNTLGTK